MTYWKRLGFPSRLEHFKIQAPEQWRCKGLPLDMSWCHPKQVQITTVATAAAGTNMKTKSFCEIALVSMATKCLGNTYSSPLQALHPNTAEGSRNTQCLAHWDACHRFPTSCLTGWGTAHSPPSTLQQLSKVGPTPSPRVGLAGKSIVKALTHTLLCTLFWQQYVGGKIMPPQHIIHIIHLKDVPPTKVRSET